MMTCSFDVMVTSSLIQPIVSWRNEFLSHHDSTSSQPSTNSLHHLHSTSQITKVKKIVRFPIPHARRATVHHHRTHTTPIDRDSSWRSVVVHFMPFWLPQPVAVIVLVPQKRLVWLQRQWSKEIVVVFLPLPCCLHPPTIHNNSVPQSLRRHSTLLVIPVTIVTFDPTRKYQHYFTLPFVVVARNYALLQHRPWNQLWRKKKKSRHRWKSFVMIINHCKLWWNILI